MGRIALSGARPEAAKNLLATSPLPMLPLGAREAMVYRSVANPWDTPEEFASYADVVKKAPRSTAWPQVVRAVQWALSDR